jgi:RND family efflux transporter MFP subunit
MEAFAGRTFNGRVTRIAPTVDQSKRTFIVEALIDNPENALKPGSYARARLATQKIDEIRLVPARAINYVLGSNKAYVVKAGAIEARDVKVGDRFDNQVEIIEGLSQGEQVATSQLNRLDTGTRVSVSSEAGTHANGAGKSSQ